MQNKKPSTDDILATIRCTHLRTSLYTMTLAQKLAQHHYETSGSTLNPFCQLSESLEFEAYRAMAEHLHNPTIH